MIFTDILVILAYAIFLPAICWGIRHEDKLIRFERALIIGIKQTINDYKTRRIKNAF